MLRLKGFFLLAHTGYDITENINFLNIHDKGIPLCYFGIQHGREAACVEGESAVSLKLVRGKFASFLFRIWAEAFTKSMF